MAYTFIIFSGFSIAFAVMGLLSHAYRDRLRIAARLEVELQKSGGIYMPAQLDESLWFRLRDMTIGNLSVIVKRAVPNNRRESYRLRLQRAGNPLNMDVDTFLVFKYGTLILMLFMGIISRSWMILAVCFLAGLILPDFFLKSKEKSRREQILRSFPDLLDLLTVSVQAGLGFDAALQKVTEKSKGPLVDEFDKTMKEISMGKPRRQALRDMAERMDIPDITTFLSAIIQADQLGISISNILSVQAHQVRETRRMKTEEKAQKAPIKMLLPLVGFIFPVILIVLLGPAIIQIMDNLLLM